MSIDVIRSRPYLNIGMDKRVYLDDLDMKDVELEDLALALSHENRYGGHTFRPFSVLEHLLLTDWLYCQNFTGADVKLDAELRLACLMHDAHEALCKDMPSPLKKILPGYRALERRIEEALWDRFGIAGVMEEGHAPVRFYDLRALNTEREHFKFEMGADADWPSLEEWPAGSMTDFLHHVFGAMPWGGTRDEGMRKYWVRLVKQLMGEVQR